MIIIIGAGFAGISACNALIKSGLDLDITLIDKKKTSDFLPSLPDALGGRIKAEFLAYEIEKLAKGKGVKFINDQVAAVNLDAREVVTKTAKFSYDYLVIASGSETNFYQNQNIMQQAYKLDDASDAEKIAGILKEREFENFIIGGGGYTGIEVAANLRIFFNRQRKDKNIIIVERANSILGPLPEWMKDYVGENLKRLNIEVVANSSIERVEGEKVYLSTGKVFENAFVVWAAGVRAADFIQSLDVPKNPQGRIKVDQYLRLRNNCFVVGDAAYFEDKGIFLRMAVQFAIMQGACAGRNIINVIKGKSLHRYRPYDLGFIIPMANNRSCGLVLGLRLEGFLPTFFHYLMCIYRTIGIKNKLGIINNLLTGYR